ncbi:MAG TPA: methylated-DNA--[protein]-cysteine S-methyltransferase [Alphaproteobacteria bacterium]|nr:methylated-DNA--[protein]-cysteine S-methyltransferase [Alphaproteobacteria bacterium]
MKSYTHLQTQLLGELLLVATATHLVGIYFSNHKHSAQLPGDWKLDPKHPILRQASEEIREYINCKRTAFSVPISFEGTEFQREIWRQIALIPFGQTISYSELARRAKAAKAVRAAGAATGRNPLGIIVPCHRVIGKNGTMTGFAGGLERKKNLLGLEAGRS